jgi:tetratricopeptide (TPR) repeat protein
VSKEVGWSFLYVACSKVMRLAMRLSAPAFVLMAAVVCSTKVSAAQQEKSERAQARRLLLEASRLIYDIPEPQQSSAVANIASQLARGGDLEDALRISQSTKKRGDQSLATGLIAWQLVQRGNVGQALSLIESIADDQNRETQYGSLAVLLAEKGDLTGAIRIAQMRKEPQGRVSILVEIAQQKARTKDFEEAGKILKQAIQIGHELVDQNASKASVLQNIAITQSEIGDLPGALLTLAELSTIAHQYEGPEGNGLMLHWLGCAQAQVGDVVGALRTHEEMVPGSNSDIVLMAIAEAQAKQGLMADALQTAERVSEVNLRSSTLRSIAIARGKHGTLQDAIEAIDRIPDSASRSEAIGALALEQAVSGNPAAALTAQRALEFTNEVSSGSVSSSTGLEMIAVARSVLGDFAGAQAIIRSMPEPESRVWPLWNLTSMLAEAGRDNEAVTLAEDEDSPLPKLHALLGTADGLLTRVASEEQASTARK